MSKTSSSQPHFNGANCNVVHGRISSGYYDFKPRVVYALGVSGEPEQFVIPVSEDLGVASDFSLTSLLAAGISPEAVSSPIGSRLDGLSQLIDFNNNNPETTE